MSSDRADYLKITYNEAPNTNNIESKRILPFNDSALYKSKLINAKQLTKGLDVKHVYDITLDLEGIERKFEPGDTIAILPENDVNEVTETLNRLNLSSVVEKKYCIEILKDTAKKKPSIPAHIPPNGTLRILFTKNLDIRSPPKKLFLKMLARFTSNTQEDEKLQHLSSPAGSQAYNNLIKEHRSLLDLLNLFPSCNPPIERILEYLGPLQPRPYSISSSPLSAQLHIIFSVIELDNKMKGVCSSWLEKLSKSRNSDSSTFGLETLNLSFDADLQFYFRQTNNFRLPEDSSLPTIMIGPGTGVAPFIGFLQHRELQKINQNKEFGPSWLFYGCRYFNKDFLYKSDIDRHLQTGVLTKLFCCSSRDGPKKTYVQDLINDHRKNFIDKVVNENAVVYVCGDAKNMAKNVKDTIANCLVDVMGWSLADADLYIKKLVQSNRYIQDLWI